MMSPLHLQLEFIRNHASESNYLVKVLLGFYTRESLKKGCFWHTKPLSFIYNKTETNHKDQQYLTMLLFLSQEEPKKVSQALADKVEVDANARKRAFIQSDKCMGIMYLHMQAGDLNKWVFRNKIDESGGTIIKNKARLVATRVQTRMEGVD
ncbi:hypothetical protein Tco_1106053 [Tanacetum coccineum]